MATVYTGGAHPDAGICDVISSTNTITRTSTIGNENLLHTDKVYNALLNACTVMENRLKESLETYQEHPDVQANLQQLQYDLQQWNLALTTMTNIQKNMADALSSVASNFR